MEKGETQGCFAVRFVKDKSMGVRFELTGDHWKAEELDRAKATVRKDCGLALANYDSPIYLVPEKVVQCVARHAEDVELATQMLLYASDPRACSDVPTDSAANRIMQSTIATLGGSTIDAPWGGALTDDEVQEILYTYGVGHGKKTMQDS